MGLYIRDTAAAAATVRKLSNDLGWDDVKVRVRRTNPLIEVEFLETSNQYGLVKVAGFTLVEQINCCGIMVSTRTYVHKDHQGKHFAQDMMPLKEAIAREFGYSALVATVNMTGNPAEVHILEKCGWTKQYEFKNKRTGNQVGFFFKSLS